MGEIEDLKARIAELEGKTSEELRGIALAKELDEAGSQIPELDRGEQMRFDKAEKAILSQNTEFQQRRLHITYNSDVGVIEFDSV